MGEENQGGCKNRSDCLRVTDEESKTSNNTIEDFQLNTELNI